MKADEPRLAQTLVPSEAPQRGVSIIIPNLNSPMVRRTVLAACTQLPEVGGGEVIVVGRDEPRGVPQHAHVRFIDTGVPVIPAVARNRGVAAASYPWLVFVDADCVPAPGWLAGLCSYLAREICAVGGAVTFGRGSYWRFSDNLAWFHAYTPGRTSGPRPYLPTISLALHRASFDAVGGFDETLPTAEDLDFTIRLRRAGVPLYFAPHARVEHLPSRFSFRALWQHSRIAGQNSIRVRMRYPDVFKMPRVLANRWVLAALSPLIAGYTVGAVCLDEPRVLRHWTALPALYLAKLAWCVGAAETLGQPARGVV